VGCGRSPGCWPARSRRAPGGLRLPWPSNATWRVHIGGFSRRQET